MREKIRSTLLLIVLVSAACLWWSCELEPEPEPFPTTLIGTVVDATTNQGISGAMVRIFGPPLVSFTDSNGIFVIKAAPAGTQMVIASKIGYGISCLRVEAKENWIVNAGSIFLPRLSPPKVIGPEGGTVTAVNGTSVYIPAGAVSVPIPISVTPILKGKGMPGPPSKERIIIAAANFGPAGTTFHKPVTLSFPIPSPALAEFNLDLFEFDATTLEWKDTGIDAIANADGITVSASVTHFSNCSIQPDFKVTMKVTDSKLTVIAKAEYQVCDEWSLELYKKKVVEAKLPHCFKELFGSMGINEINGEWTEEETEANIDGGIFGFKYRVEWEESERETKWKVGIGIVFAPSKVTNNILPLPCSFTVRMTENWKSGNTNSIGKCHDQGGGGP
jgi:hypothetical protein